MDEILKACLDGEDGGWDRFVDRYAGVIYAAVQKVLSRRLNPGDRGPVDDVVQDVFIRLLKDDRRLLKTFDPPLDAVVKKTVVGVGHADKKQVEHMVRLQLPGIQIAGSDAADALAIAICHAHHGAGVTRLREVRA